jgi:putative PIN family toxin of toxin-antitoxin system
VLSVTADTNIYVSAFNYRGKPRELIKLANAGAIRLDVSEAIIRETRRVLVDKFGWSPEGAAVAESQMRRLARLVRPAEEFDAIKEDPSDNRILECAQAGRSDYIVTGDKDLLRLRVFRDIPIVKVADFLAMAEGRWR